MSPVRQTRFGPEIIHRWASESGFGTQQPHRETIRTLHRDDAGFGDGVGRRIVPGDRRLGRAGPEAWQWSASSGQTSGRRPSATGRARTSPMRRAGWEPLPPRGSGPIAGTPARRHGAGCRPNTREKFCRSLHWSSGWSKKTQTPCDDGVPRFRQPAQVAVGHHCHNASAMTTRSVAHGDAKIGQFKGAWSEKSGELHARSLAGMATPRLGRCDKLAFSIRRSYQRSTGRIEREM